MKRLKKDCKQKPHTQLKIMHMLKSKTIPHLDIYNVQQTIHQHNKTSDQGECTNENNLPWNEKRNIYILNADIFCKTKRVC